MAMLTVKEIRGKIEGNKVVDKKIPNNLAYNMIMKNAHLEGNRRVATIPLELLVIDDSYQRVNCISKEKIKSLISHFDINKCDAILVAPHPETCTFAVINGSHRIIATDVLKLGDIFAVFAENLPTEPNARRMKEAELFCDQNKDVDHMSPAHKHNAYVTMGVKKHVVLEECLKGRKLFIDSHILKNKPDEEKDALIAEGYKILTGYNEAVHAAAHSRGKELLNTIFDIIAKSGWHEESNGYSSNVIRSISAVINLHDFDPAVTEAIINIFTNIKPKLFMAKAYAAFPGRKEKEAHIMWLEREVARKLNMEPLYTGGDMRKITSKINKARSLEGKTTPFLATGTEA